MLVYRLTETMPEHEEFGVISQIRRASVSIPSNIAEGHGRRSDGDFARFCAISLGSCREVQTLTIICKRLGYIESEEDLVNSCEEIAKMLTSLIKKLRSST